MVGTTLPGGYFPLVRDPGTMRTNSDDFGECLPVLPVNGVGTVFVDWARQHECIWQGLSIERRVMKEVRSVRR